MMRGTPTAEQGPGETDFCGLDGIASQVQQPPEAIPQQPRMAGSGTSAACRDVRGGGTGARRGPAPPSSGGSGVDHA